MRRTLLIGLLAIAALSLPAAAASADIVGCGSTGQGGAVEGYGGAIDYEQCSTTENGGIGSALFSSGGNVLSLSAQSRRGAQQTAAGWQSAGPVDHTGEICVSVNVSRLSTRGSGYARQLLAVSYNNQQRPFVLAAVTVTGTETVCDTVPSGAENVWWQLLTLTGASKPFGQVSLTERFVGVRYND